MQQFGPSSLILLPRIFGKTIYLEHFSCKCRKNFLSCFIYKKGFQTTCFMLRDYKPVAPLGKTYSLLKLFTNLAMTFPLIKKK